jgi:ABC-type phosphonate transport system ATPase subunit
MRYDLDTTPKRSSGPIGRMKPLLAVRVLTRRFGDVAANDGVDFDVAPGEVHAVLGENGAGRRRWRTRGSDS